MHVNDFEFSFCGLWITFENYSVFLAISIPDLDSIVSLIGAFGSSSLGLIFPPIIEIIINWPDKFGRYKWILWKDIAIMYLGVFSTAFGTYASISGMFQKKTE